MTSQPGAPGPGGWTAAQRDWASPGGPPPPGWSPEQPPAWGRSTPYAPPPPPRPGIIPLRPLGVGEILDGAFTLLRRQPRATIGFAALVMLVVEVVRVVSDYAFLNGVTAPASGSSLSRYGDYFARAATSSLVSVAVTALAMLLLTGAVTAVAGEAVLGRPTSAGAAWRALRPLFGRLVGVSVLTWLIVVGILVVSVVPGLALLAAGADQGGGLLVALGFLVALVPAVWVWTLLSLAPAALVLEKQTVTGALRRSRLLVRGSWWRVFGILLLAMLIAGVVSAIISIPFGIAGGGLTGFDTTGTFDFTGLVVSGVGGLIADTIVRPFSAGVVALLYIDRRMRAEALDLALVRAAEHVSA